MVVTIWDLQQPHIPGVPLPHPSWVSVVAISSDSRWLYTGTDSWYSAIRVWDLHQLTPAPVDEFRLQEPYDEVAVLALSADGRWLATDGQDNTIVI